MIALDIFSVKLLKCFIVIEYNFGFDAKMGKSNKADLFGFL